jgi:hypothetical protein
VWLCEHQPARRLSLRICLSKVRAGAIWRSVLTRPAPGPTVCSAASGSGRWLPRRSPTPARSYSERLWGRARPTPGGLAGTRPASPLMAYRWARTEAVLTAQLVLEDGVSRRREAGPHRVRYTNPATGGDALTTVRTEFHRVPARGMRPSMPYGRRVGHWQCALRTRTKEQDHFISP